MSKRMPRTEWTTALAISVALLVGPACAKEGERDADPDDGTNTRVDQPPANDDSSQANAGAGSENADEPKADEPIGAGSGGSEIEEQNEASDPTGPRKVAVLPDPAPGGQSGAEGSCDQPCPDWTPPEPIAIEDALALVLGSHETTLRFADRAWSHGEPAAAPVEKKITLEVAARPGEVVEGDPGFVNECGGVPSEQLLVDVAMRSDDGVLDVTFPGRVTLHRDQDDAAWLRVYFTDHSLFPAGFVPEPLLGSHHDDVPFSLSIGFRADAMHGYLWVYEHDPVEGVDYNCSVAELEDTSCVYGTSQPFDSAVGAFQLTELIDALNAGDPKPVQWSDGSSTMLTIHAEPRDRGVCRKDIFSECTDLEQIDAGLALHIVTDDGRLDVWMPVNSHFAASPTQGWDGDQTLRGDLLGPLSAFEAGDGKVAFEVGDGKRVLIGLRIRVYESLAIDSGEIYLYEITPAAGAPGADRILDIWDHSAACYGGSSAELDVIRWGDPNQL